MNYFRIFGFAALTAGAVFGQDVISARSGLIHYTEGKVFLEDKQVAPKKGEFPDVKEGQVLRTEMGRAEVLFSPGVFLRVSENSSFRMLTNALENTAIELTAGSVLLEVGELQKEQSIRIVLGLTSVEVSKPGLFRIDADPGRLRVYDGAAVVASKDGAPATIKEGKQTLLAGVVSPEKFNKEVGDAFHRWAGRRSGYIAMANVAATRSMGTQMSRWQHSSWLYNPYFGAFTYIPFSGRYVTPWGWSYYSPNYMPPPVSYSGDSGYGAGGGMMSSGRGYGDMGGRGSVSSAPSYSGGSASPGPSASPAPAAAPRGADGGGSRSSQGGR